MLLHVTNIIYQISGLKSSESLYERLTRMSVFGGIFKKESERKGKEREKNAEGWMR